MWILKGTLHFIGAWRHLRDHVLSRSSICFSLSLSPRPIHGLCRAPLLNFEHLICFRIMWLLLKHGARVNQKNKLGLTAVHLAAANGNLQALKVYIPQVFLFQYLLAFQYLVIYWKISWLESIVIHVYADWAVRSFYWKTQIASTQKQKQKKPHYFLPWRMTVRTVLRFFCTGEQVLMSLICG